MFDCLYIILDLSRVDSILSSAYCMCLQSFAEAARAEITAGLQLLVDDQPPGSATAKFLSLAQGSSYQVRSFQSFSTCSFACQFCMLRGANCYRQIGLRSLYSFNTCSLLLSQSLQCL